MDLLGKIFAFVVGALSIGAVKSFFEKNQVIILSKDDSFIDDEEDLVPQDIIKLRPQNLDAAMDLRGTPTHVCPCGSEVWNLKVIFDNFEIGTYFLDMECANCGSLATAPTPVDRQGTERDI